MKKIVIFLVVIFFILFLFLRKRSGKVFQSEVVGKGKIEVIVSASGEVKSENEVKVQFQTSGKLAWLGVKEGDLVKKGQALASLDKEQLKKTLSKAMNDYLTNRWNFEQERTDYKWQTDHELIDESLKRILEKSQFSLNKAVTDVEIADLAIRYATIYSPISGIVTAVEPAIAGVNILYTSAYVEIADPLKMEFEAIVDEVDITKLKIDQPVVITLDAFPDQEFSGLIKRIAFKSSTTTSGGTGYAVYLSLPEEIQESLRIGLNGDFKVVVEFRNDILVVPYDSVFEEDGKNYLFRIKGDQALKTEIKTGLTSEDQIEIVSGLNEGEMIISEDPTALKDSQKVRLR